MRPLQHGDIVAAARVIMGYPEGERLGVCRRMIQEADFADRYFKRKKRAHLLWGDGSLMAAALMRPAGPEPSLSDLTYCSCLELVLHEILEWRQARLNLAHN